MTGFDYQDLTAIREYKAPEIEAAERRGFINGFATAAVVVLVAAVLIIGLAAL